MTTCDRPGGRGLVINTGLTVLIGMSNSSRSADVHRDQSVGANRRVSDDHHAGLWSGLVRRVDALVAAAGTCPDGKNCQLRDDLLGFLHGDVLAHLRTEEQIMYSAARGAGLDALVAALELDHRFLMELVANLERSENELQIALAGRALVTLVGLRIEKEETVLIPALRAAGMDESDLLDGMVVAMATNYDSHFTYL